MMAKPRKQIAYFVDGDHDEETIRRVFAKHVDGWSELSTSEKAEAVVLMQANNKRVQAAQMEIVETEAGKALRIADGDNVTLHSLRLTSTFGTRSQALINDRMSDLACYPRPGPKGGLNAESEQLSAALAFVAGGQAADPVQATLLVQMAATHDAAMRALGATARVQHIEQTQVFGNLAAKFLNAYTRQAETLAKLQRGGEQVIKHIHIDNRGGQAVVTDQLVAGGQNAESREQALGPSPISPALSGPNPLGVVVPMPGSERQPAMQAARRREGNRRAKG